MTGSHCRVELAHDVGERIGGMKGHVPRTGPITRPGSAGINLLQLAGRGVDAEREYLVESLVGHDDEAPGWIEFDLVGFREGLLDPMRADLAGQGNLVRQP